MVPSRAAPPEVPAVEAPALEGASSGLAGAHVVPSEAAAPEDPLAREMRLLNLANAMHDGDPREALARYDVLAREFPHGQMAAEREFLAVSALRTLGRDDEARSRGERLIAQFPTSPYASRTRRLLDTVR